MAAKEEQLPAAAEAEQVEKEPSVPSNNKDGNAEGEPQTKQQTGEDDKRTKTATNTSSHQQEEEGPGAGLAGATEIEGYCAEEMETRQDVVEAEEKEVRTMQPWELLHEEIVARRAIVQEFDSQLTTDRRLFSLRTTVVHSSSELRRKEQSLRRDIEADFYRTGRRILEIVEAWSRRNLREQYRNDTTTKIMRTDHDQRDGRRQVQWMESLSRKEIGKRRSIEEGTFGVHEWAFFEAFDAVHWEHERQVYFQEMEERCELEKWHHYVVVAQYQFRVLYADRIVRSEAIVRVLNILREERRSRASIELNHEAKKELLKGPAQAQMRPISKKGSVHDMVKTPSFRRQTSSPQSILSQHITSRAAKRRQIALAAADELMLTEAVTYPTWHELLEAGDEASPTGIVVDGQRVSFSALSPTDSTTLGGLLLPGGEGGDVSRASLSAGPLVYFKRSSVGNAASGSSLTQEPQQQRTGYSTSAETSMQQFSQGMSYSAWAHHIKETDTAVAAKAPAEEWAPYSSRVRSRIFVDWRSERKRQKQLAQQGFGEQSRRPTEDEQEGKAERQQQLPVETDRRVSGDNNQQQPVLTSVLLSRASLSGEPRGSGRPPGPTWVDNAAPSTPIQHSSVMHAAREQSIRRRSMHYAQATFTQPPQLTSPASSSDGEVIDVRSEEGDSVSAGSPLFSPNLLSPTSPSTREGFPQVFGGGGGVGGGGGGNGTVISPLSRSRRRFSSFALVPEHFRFLMDSPTADSSRASMASPRSYPASSFRRRRTTQLTDNMGELVERAAEELLLNRLGRLETQEEYCRDTTWHEAYYNGLVFIWSSFALEYHRAWCDNWFSQSSRAMHEMLFSVMMTSIANPEFDVDSL